MNSANIIWNDSEDYESFADIAGGFIRLWVRRDYGGSGYKAGVSGYNNHWTKKSFATMDEARKEAVKLGLKWLHNCVEQIT
jgi:hypothetical protein